MLNKYKKVVGGGWGGENVNFFFAGMLKVLASNQSYLETPKGLSMEH